MESFTIENGVLIKADPCLTHAVIPEGVREIGKEAFGEGKYSPHTNDLLQSVVIPSTVGKISDYAFSRCAALTEITIPGNVKIIGAEAFSCCSNLKTVVLENGVEEIGCSVFRFCANLDTLRIPKSVKRIGRDAFYGIENLHLVYEIGDLAAWIKDPPLDVDSRLKVTQSFELDGKPLYDLVIPEGIREITYGLFHGSPFRSVTLPDGIEFIRCDAFAFCEDLTAITLPKSVKYVNSRAFEGCKNLRTVSCHDTVSADRDAFKDCPALELILEVDDPDTWWKTRKIHKEIPVRPMKNGESITALTVPEGTEVITEWAFARIRGITRLVLPDSVKKIERFAFFGCSDLTEIRLPAGELEIAETAFDDITFVDHNPAATAFTHCHRYTEEDCEKAVKIKNIGSFALSPITDEEKEALIAVCNDWKWLEGHRSYTDYSGTDFEWSQDGYSAFSEYDHKLYPVNCLVKNGEVIGFVYDGVPVLIPKPRVTSETSDHERFAHRHDSFWKIFKR